jgi:hypothetical protein
MNIDKRWFLPLVAAGAAIGAAVASASRRRHRRIARDLHDQERTAEHKSWENEGGNLAPTPVAPALP